MSKKLVFGKFKMSRHQMAHVAKLAKKVLHSIIFCDILHNIPLPPQYNINIIQIIFDTKGNFLFC